MKLQTLCQQWLRCARDGSDFAEHWDEKLGEQTRQYLQAQPYLGTEQHERGPLSAALERLQLTNAEQDWAAHTVLALYLRQYCTSAESTQIQHTQAPHNWLNWLKERFQTRHLQLFPAAEPGITLVMPTYQRLSELQRAVASVQAQSDPNWQLIIGDDASPDDGIQAWCEALCEKDTRIKYLRNEKNQGFWFTFNRLYRSAETEWISNLSDDDVLMPEWLASMRRLITAFPWIALAGGGYYSLHLIKGQLKAKQSGPYYPQDRVIDPQTELQRCALEAPVFGGGMLVRRSALRAISTQAAITGDWEYNGWDWWIIAQMLARYEVAYAPEIVAVYMNHTEAYQHTYDRDWGQPFAFLCEQMVENYEALFGPKTFPPELLRYQLDMVIEPNIIQSFRSSLAEMPNTKALDTAIAKQTQTWQCFRKLKKDILPSCQQNVPYLIAENTISGLTGGHIPGIERQAIRPELQALIQDLLRK